MGKNRRGLFHLFQKKRPPQYQSVFERKTTWENGVIKETRDYMENFEYKDDKIERIHHAEGVITQRAKRTDEGTEFVGLGGLVWQYEYVLKDHLGNTRVTFADLLLGMVISRMKQKNGAKVYKKITTRKKLMERKEMK